MHLHVRAYATTTMCVCLSDCLSTKSANWHKTGYVGIWAICRPKPTKIDCVSCDAEFYRESSDISPQYL